MQALVVNLLAIVTVVGSGVAHGAALRSSRRTLAGLVVLDAVALTLVSTAAQNPPLFRAWMQEDGWAEWSTCLAFLVAAIGGAVWVRRSEGQVPPLARLAVSAISAFCVFVAGEEISWGQRLFAFVPPDVFLHRNYQQELNLHNFLKHKSFLGFPLDTRFVIAAIACGYGIALPLAARLNWSRWWPEHVGTAARYFAPTRYLVPGFAAVAWVELAYPVDLAGESAELLLGLLFVADAAERRSPRSRAARTRHPTWQTARLVALPVALGPMVQPVVERLVYGADEAAVALARSELEQLRRDLEIEGVARHDKWRSKRSVHKRLFTATQAGYFRFGAGSSFLRGQRTPAELEKGGRRDRRGYFIDPWSNPYWVIYRRAQAEILIYSFGPDRRRDSEFDDRGWLIDGIGGDDIAVRIAAPRRSARATRHGEGVQPAE
ncbi:MAG: hypothetical protein B7733_01340 [Myxococcales bacterium FL481]|nr:MAG: hypothetical protein B7733_01340 [Myxococcales bacterium FL481]